MPHYIYTAVDPKGKKMTGAMEAGNYAQLGIKLKEKNLFIVKAEDKSDIRISKEIGSGQKVKLKPLAIFCRLK